jgi:hypothetical protein
MRRRIHVSASVLSNTVCHMRRRRIHVSYEEEDTRVSFSPIQHCVSYEEEEDTCVI